MSNSEMVESPAGQQIQTPGGALARLGLTVFRTTSGRTAAALYSWEMDMRGINGFARTFGYNLLVASVATATGASVFERHTNQMEERVDGTVRGPYRCEMGVCDVTEWT